jgi:hypothetical protein
VNVDVGEINTVYFHEGEKCALLAMEIAKKCPDHPWALELTTNCIHLGWDRRATNSYRSNWPLLNRFLKEKKVARVVVVLDNDKPGINALRNISQYLAKVDIPVFAVWFPDTWESGFDIADEFPRECYVKGEDGVERYNGPSLCDCLRPATWATQEHVIPDSNYHFHIRVTLECRGMR